MRFLVLNIFLALVWAFLQGELRAAHLVVGFVIGYLLLGLSQSILDCRAYSLKVLQVARFLLFVAWDIFTASLALAWLMLQPRLKIRPAVVGVPLDVKTDLEIVILANLISLSPGTLSMDLSKDQSTLYVHTIDLKDADAFRSEIKNGLERRVLEVMR